MCDQLRTLPPSVYKVKMVGDGDDGDDGDDDDDGSPTFGKWSQDDL